MNTEKLAAFVSQTMDISGNIPTMGGAAGIFGITSMGAQTVNDLKHAAINFAVEYRKDAVGEATLRLSKEVEGLLSTLQATSVISNERYEQLVDDLHRLTGKASVS